MFLNINKTLAGVHATIKNMMEHPNGGFKWSNTHNLPYKLNKLAVMNYPRTPLDAPPSNLHSTKTNSDGSTTTQTVQTTDTYKYLGVILDPKLRWTTHHQKVIAKATWWSHQVSRLSKISGGMPPKQICQLYNTIAIPALTYAVDIWYTGNTPSTSSLPSHSYTSITRKLTSIQRHITKIITGSLNTAAGDILEAHANILPIDLLFNKVLHCAALRIAALPPSHPLHPLAQKAARHQVKKHCSPLHNLFYATGVSPSSVETITAIQRRPNYTPSFTTTILDNKPDTIATAYQHHNTQISIYCDGSGFENGIGAAAVMYINKTEF